MFNVGIDQIIFFAFLAMFLVFGLISSHGVKSLREYAVGNKTFSTAILIATNVAATLSGSGFFCDLSETYSNGLYYLWAAIGGIIAYYLIVALVFIPRMGEFMNNISLAEAMGDIFGKEVRLITAIVGFFAMSSFIAMQFQVIGKLCHYGLNIPSHLGIILMGLIITIYSAIGGIKSVTFTDMIQFITFSTILPIIAYFIYDSSSSFSGIVEIFINNELYDVNKVFDFSNIKSVSYLSLFFIYAIPGFDPSRFQQIIIAKNVNQARKSYFISCLFCVIIVIISCLISLIVYIQNPHLEGDEVFSYILNHSGKIMKGLTLVGVLAMIMSTADSFINSISVTFVHDLFQPIGIKKFQDKELAATKLTAFLIGCIAIFLAIKNNNLLSLLKLGVMFLTPITTPAFLMALLGFRPHKYCIMTGMVAGIIGTTIWAYIINFPAIDSPIPGMIMNFLTLYLSHYIFGLPGGWVKIQADQSLEEEKQKKRLLIASIYKKINNFNFKNFFFENALVNDYFYVHFGILSSIITFLNVLSLPNYFDIDKTIAPLYIISMTLSTILTLYPLWKKYFNNKIIVSFLWFFLIFYSFIVLSTFLLIISNISSIQLIFFFISLLLVFLTLNKEIGFILYIAGIILAFVIYKFLFDHDIDGKLQLLGLFFCSFNLLIFFDFKGKNFNYALNKINYLTNSIKIKTDELHEALSLKYKFINNVTHEYNAPLTGIVCLTNELKHSYDQLDDEKRKEIINNIFKSSKRLKIFEENLASLQKLNNSFIELEFKLINISDLLVKSLNECKKLHIPEAENGNRIFETNIENNLFIHGDRYYLLQALDNLITNAINYCLIGKIEISLKILNNKLNFSIIDDGIGIPNHELNLIFEEFKVSSLTYTPSGGRGVGLSVCKKVIEAHFGHIWAKNNNYNGKNKIGFYFEIPVTVK